MRGRSRVREGFNIWPGFVDALTTLLIMLLFVLTVFTAMQVFLGDALSGREKTISALSTEREQLRKDVAAERARIAQAERDIESLHSELRSTVAQRERLERERSALEVQKADAERRIAGLEKDIEAQKAEAERRISGLEKDLETRKAEAARRIAGLEKEKDDLVARIAGLDREKLAALARIGALERESAENKRAAEADRAKSAGEKSELERRLEALEA